MNTEEQNSMGLAYLEGKNGVSKNVEKACGYFLKAAEEYTVKNELEGRYSWSRSAIDVRSLDDDKKTGDLVYMVPFYFYIYRKDGKTLTLRVNGSDGTVDVFRNNPFALKGKGKTAKPKEAKPAKKFSFGIFLLLTLFTGVGGILYAIYCALKK